MPKFNVNDRVEFIGDYEWNDLQVGMEGVIKDIDSDGDLGIEFDYPINGHGLFGKGKLGHCVWLAEDQIKLIHNNSNRKFKIGDEIKHIKLPLNHRIITEITEDSYVTKFSDNSMHNMKWDFDYIESSYILVPQKEYTPKFKAGDIIQSNPTHSFNNTHEITGIDDKYYTIKEMPKDIKLSIDYVDKHYSLKETEPQETVDNTASAFSTQIAGNHYKILGVQPLEACYMNRGYEAFSGACYTKVLKYMDRKKDNQVEQLKKARHVLDMWIEKAESEAKK